MSTEIQPERIDVHQVLTDRIIALLSAGTIPWLVPWKSEGQPKNLISGRSFKGINGLLLSSLGYTQNFYLTFDQLKQLAGGNVNRGEHGHVVSFWKTPSPKAGNDGNGTSAEKPHSILKYYKVFNIAQCNNIHESVLPAIQMNGFTPTKECEAIAEGMPNCPKIITKENRAYYDLELDIINMPRKALKSPELYYPILFRLLVHATSHQSRVGRKTLTKHYEFGAENYSREDLVAEIGGALLCNHTGILEANYVRDVTHMQTWLSKFTEDKELVVVAAARAQQAVDFILNLPKVQNSEEDATPEIQLRA